MSWVGVAVAVGSTLVNSYEQSQVAKKQDKVLAGEMLKQGQTRQKIAANTANLVNQEKGQTAQPQQDLYKQNLDNAIKANASTATAPYQTVGATSDAYKKAAKDTALGVAKSTDTRAGLMAGMAAPGMQRQDLQKVFDNYQIGNSQLNQSQQGQNFLDNLKLQSIHANPWVSLLTGVGSAYARGRGAANASDFYNGANDEDGAFGLSMGAG